MPVLLLGSLLAGCVDEEPGDDPTDVLDFRALEDGLELHWTFEDSVGSQITDLSGKGRHGTLEAGATLVTSPDGKAVSLDGVDDYVSLVGPRSPALYGGADGSFTISAQIKVSDVSKYNTLCYGCGPFSFMYAGTSNYGAAAMSAFDDQASANKLWALSSPTLVANTWTQLTLVVENGAVASYYIDCSLSGQLSNANIGLEDPGFSAVGFSSNAARWFGGEIDELRVWNRALDATELDALCPAPGITDDLELHWTFEDRNANQITDVSGNGRHGNNIGGTFVASPDGEAVSLDGVNDKISFPGPRALSLYGGEQGDFTVSARVKVADVNKYNTFCFGCGPMKFMYVGDPSPGARVLSLLKNLDTAGNLWAASSQVLSNDEWAEVTLVVEGGVAARTYYDCGLAGTTNANVGLVDTGYSAIGESSNPGYWFGGEIDELRIWSRALTEADLDQVCTRGLCDGPIYVDIDAGPGGDGTSWATAFNTIQGALDAAAVCDDPQLWLAEGQYAPNQNWYVATITYPVSIYGGFSGVETSLLQRDFATHDTVIGGEGWTQRAIAIDVISLPAGETVRIDGIRISDTIRGAIGTIGFGNPFDGTLILDNLTVTDNYDWDAGAGLDIRGTGSGSVQISNSNFTGNDSAVGAAAYLFGNGVDFTITNSSFVDNHATGDGGGAIKIYDPTDLTISDSVFDINIGSWGGAIWVDDNYNTPELAKLTMVDTTFSANESNRGGALYIEESTSSIDNCLFVDNAAAQAGAIQIANQKASVLFDEAVIQNSRFVGNSATSGTGGAIHLQEDFAATVINSEFVNNSASNLGGAVLGRGTFVASTFAGNTAPNGGSALYAYNGPDMYMEHCVAYSNTVTGVNIYAPYSCITQNPALKGSPITQLTQNPFEPADLDLDGLTEYYLLPDGPCVGLDGGVIDEFDWTSLTVDISQCTDSGWPEPGVHYVPQSAAGVCE